GLFGSLDMDIVQAILGQLDGCDTLSSLTLADLLNVDHQTVVGGIKSLQSMGEVINCEQVTETVYELTNEGQDVAKNGSHEFRVYSAVPACGVSQNSLLDEFPNAKIGLSKALAARWLKIVKDPANGPKIYRAVISSDVITTLSDRDR
ncbi:phenylalanyl-tRNA synthetase alpha chain, partial [Paragonimus westermani]